ncbi:MAG TPA: flagellar motor switch protein FliN [Phycisphaerales bacterium]|nr:flagellar motor switch protein FliN [Phycisphaerales bacterium]
MSEESTNPTPPPDAPPPEASTPVPAPDAAASAESAATEALNAAQTAAEQLGAETGAASDEPGEFKLPDFTPPASSEPVSGIDLLADVILNVRIELGRTRMLVEDVLKLASGSVVELDKLAGDPVDVLVNDRPVARGEVLVLNDNFCVRINEILDPGTEL